MSFRTNLVLLVLGYIALGFIADSVQQFLVFVGITIIAGFVIAVFGLLIEIGLKKLG